PDGSGAEAAEDREGVLGSRFPDELAARLDLTVQARRERVGVLLRGGADDEVVEAAHRVVPLALERLRQGLRLVTRGALDPDLPRRVAAIELLLFPRLAGRLVVPPLLVLEPVLDAGRMCGAAEAAQLGLDHAVGALGLRLRRGVDEDLVAVPRDCEPALLQLARELARLLVEIGAEPVEQAAGMRLLDLDADAPVVCHGRRAY